MNFNFSRCTLYVLIAMLCAVNLVPNNTYAQSGAQDKTDAYIKNLMRSDTVPGIAIAVLKSGVIQYTNYSGLANIEQSAPVTGKSVFQIASITKQFTAAAIMLLVQEHKIDLKKPVSTYLHDAPAEWRDITIENLLTHTSGIMNYEDIAGFAEKAYLDSAHKAVLPSILNALYKQKLIFQPNEKSIYCNSNYFVLGAVIEAVTGEDYELYLKRNILVPLKMDHTVINEMYHIVENRVAGYSTADHKLMNADRLGMDWFFAEGNIITTLDDMIKWLDAFANHRLLLPSTLAKMIAPTKLKDGSTGQFGYGWFVDQADPSIIYHSGHTPGFSAFVFHNNRSKLSFILLSNTENIKTDKLLAIAKKVTSFY